MLWLLPWALPAAAELGVPYIPARDSEVLQKLPAALELGLQKSDRLRQQQRPDDLASALQLAQDYIDYGRGSGDARYLGRAAAVIQPWLQRQPAPVAARMLQATILQSRHQFALSRAVLGAILQADPDNGQAWLTLATVAQTQGDMTAARHACARLMGAMDALLTAACLGGLDSVTGRAQDGYAAMALLLAQEPGEPPKIRAWVQGLLADAALYQGRSDLAEQHFKAALLLAPGDDFLLDDYCDFLLDRQRPGEVLALAAGHTQSDTVLLRLVLAESRLGAPQAAADADDLAQRFRDLHLRGDAALYGREEARFLLEVRREPAPALAIAQANWAIQRAPPDARVYLEAALAARQPQAARPVLEFLEQTHLEDPAVLALAGTS